MKAAAYDSTRMVVGQVKTFQLYSVMSCLYNSRVDGDGFGPLGQSTGGMKSSQITASSSQSGTYLPYSAKLEHNLSGWSPFRSSGEELHVVHFIHVDLRDAIQTKFTVSIVQYFHHITVSKAVIIQKLWSVI